MKKNKSIRLIKLGIVFSQVLLLFLIYSCETYHLANGKKYRNLFPVKDEHYISDSFLNKNRFDLKLFLEPDTNGIVQFIFPEDIEKILNEIDEILLIFYYPNCSGADLSMDTPKFADKNKIPYILISDTYSPRRMKNLYNSHELSNKNQYIMPTLENGEKLLLKKQINFMKDLSPNLYETHKESLMFYDNYYLTKKNDKGEPIDEISARILDKNSIEQFKKHYRKDL